MRLRRWLISLLSTQHKERIKAQLQAFDTRLVMWFARIPLLSAVFTSIYYLSNGRFAAQQRAGLAGRVAFVTQQHSNALSGFLRRHIHRLEKGLIMQPRKSVFALDYIAQTLSVFSQGLEQKLWSEADKQWAVSVLEAYFAAVDLTHPAIAVSFADFKSMQQSYGLSAANAAPYPFSERTQSDISFEQLTLLMHQRRSVRWFTAQPVTDTTLEAALTTAAQAPSACNRQSFKFISFTSPTDAQRVGAIAGGTAGFAQQFPCLLVLVGDLSAYPYEKDRHVIYIDGALASMQLMLALETLGVSSCPINWADEPVANTKMQAELNLPAHQRVLMLLAVGYAEPQGGIAYSAKKDISELWDPR